MDWTQKLIISQDSLRAKHGCAPHCHANAHLPFPVPRLGPRQLHGGEDLSVCEGRRVTHGRRVLDRSPHHMKNVKLG